MLDWARRAWERVFGNDNDSEGEHAAIHVTELVVTPTLVRGDGDARLRVPAGAELTVEVRVGPVQQGQRIAVLIQMGSARKVIAKSPPMIVEAEAAGVYPRFYLPPLEKTNTTYRLVVTVNGKPLRYRRLAAVTRPM